MFLILALLYTNVINSPSVLVRFAYIVALLVPVINKTEGFPAIVLCVMGVAKNAFSQPIVPTQMVFYIAIAFVFAIFSLRSRGYQLKISRLFVFTLFYSLINDMMTYGELSDMTLVILILVLLFFCIEEANESSIDFIAIAIIIVSVIVAYWVMFHLVALVHEYNNEELNTHQSSWIDPNYLSIALGAGVVIAAMKLVQGCDNYRQTVLLSFITIFVSIALLRLASRGVLLATIIAVAIMLIFTSQSLLRRAAIIVFTIGLVLFLYKNQYFDLVVTRINEEQKSADERLMIWTAKSDDFFNHYNMFNWIFGIGQGEGFLLGRLSGVVPSTGYSTHNDYLSILFFYGLIGIFLFFRVIMYAVRICSKAKRPYIIALLSFLLICSLTIEPLARGNIAYWSLFFYIIVLARQSHKSVICQETTIR